MPAMRGLRTTLTAVAGASLLGAGFVARQVWRTVHRPDLPSFANQDISGTFGDPTSPPLRIVAVGDSALTAPGIKNLDDAWLRRLARIYADRHRVELTSLGVGGSRAGDVLTGQLAAAVALQPDIAVVNVGGNDVIRAVPVRRYADALGTIVGRLEEASGAVLLLGVGDLGAIPRLPPTLRPYLSHRSMAFDRACARVGEGRARTIKTDAGRSVGTHNRALQDLFAADQFHASAAGHGLFADTIAPYFADAYRLAAQSRPGLGDG